MTVLEEIKKARQQSRNGKVYSNLEAEEILRRLRRSEEQIRNGLFYTKDEIKTIFKKWLKN
jgi:hypothetical protein